MALGAGRDPDQRDGRITDIAPRHALVQFPRVAKARDLSSIRRELVAGSVGRALRGSRAAALGWTTTTAGVLNVAGQAELRIIWLVRRAAGEGG